MASQVFSKKVRPLNSAEELVRVLSVKVSSPRLLLLLRSWHERSSRVTVFVDFPDGASFAWKSLDLSKLSAFSFAYSIAECSSLSSCSRSWTLQSLKLGSRPEDPAGALSLDLLLSVNSSGS